MNIRKLIFITFVIRLFPVFADDAEFKLGGKWYCRQVFDGNGRQVTQFKNWELISDFFVSPERDRLLVYHRPDKARAFLITLYDLRSGNIIAEVEPGWACFGIYWMKDYLVYKWATTGGGTRFEYRSYKTLAVEKTVTAFFPFEDEEDDILIESSYFYGDKKIVFRKFSDGSEIKSFDIAEELSKKGINTSGAGVSDIEKAGKRKYKFSVGYNPLEEGRDNEDCQADFELEL